jgi:YVTN family beta-propeller protein
VTVAAGSVWVTDHQADTVTRFDPATGERQATIQVGDGPSAVTFGTDLVGGQAIWVANELGGTVSRIDPSSDREVATIQVGTGVTELAFGEGAL